MARTGRPPKPAAIRRLEGNPGKRAVPDGVQCGGVPFVADFLDDDAKAAVELVRRSMPPSLYAAVDGFTLARFATAWSLFKRASEELNREGLLSKGSTGQVVVTPWLRVQSDADARMERAGVRLGLDPLARQALKVSGNAKPVSKFAGLINQTRSSDSLSN